MFSYWPDLKSELAKDDHVEPKQAGDYNISQFVTEEDLLKMKCERFHGFLPDADPEYLRQMAEEFGDDEIQIQVNLNYQFYWHILLKGPQVIKRI